MKLLYYNQELNFGDALNRMIFDYFIPELLDNDETEVLMGIGTLLGLIFPPQNTSIVYVFSSGGGYGTFPKNDKRYEFLCVRGPLTAKNLDLDVNTAVTDGAVLLKGLPIEMPKKVYAWSYIPHWGSSTFYSHWEKIVSESGGHFISPVNEPEFVIQEILKSKVVIAEAMHGAIVADTFRIPWIPVKGYKHINDFKWKDWLQSLNMEYDPVVFPSLFDKSRYYSAFDKKFGFLNSIKLLKVIPYCYFLFQKITRERKVKKQLKNILKNKMWLSDEELLESKYNQLLEILKVLKMKKSIKTDS